MHQARFRLTAGAPEFFEDEADPLIAAIDGRIAGQLAALIATEQFMSLG